MNNKIIHESEKEFACFLESQGKSFVPQPRTFRYNGTSYRPDFYCPEDDIYYEVKTQLSSKIAIRLLEFKKFYPYIKLKIVSPNGYPYYSRSSSKCLELIERRLNFLKSRDILEISLNEFQDNIRDFHILEKRKDWENIKSFNAREGMMKDIHKAKKKLGIKQ